MYKSELREAIIKLLNGFYQEEQGNRVTSNIVDGLTLKIIKLLEANEVAEEPGKEKDTKQ